ncbi:hypothetical protein [Sphingopyxis terrae]|uniref:hypothetical protein n=1 Tax=Sphingopyxis terrae TaxID=33052 RepID=UPI001C2C548F|nr:hypothetical protein [Sphingopyxis terrae]QXF10872.1 hypothetical protein HBA51_00915 [Sphingopyxis terrae subsp. terrae]
MKSVMILAGIMAMAAAAPTAAARESFVLEIGGEQLTGLAPEGYCVPKGRDKEASDLLATGDTQNFTLIMLIRCDRQNHPQGFGADYFLIKAARETIDVVMERTEFLRLMEAEIGKAEWRSGETSDALLKNASKDVSSALGTDIAISGTLRPHGVDTSCAYLGGSLSVATDGKTLPIVAGACLTSVAGKLLSVNAYDEAKPPVDAAVQMRRARALAMQLKAAP